MNTSVTSAKRPIPIRLSSIVTPEAVLGKSIQATAYTSLVHPQLEYMLQLSGVHILWITLTRLKQFRDMQHDLWWVTGAGHSQSGRSSSSKGSPTLMMDHGTTGLEHIGSMYRNQASVMMYRIINGLTAIPAPLYVTPNAHPELYTSRHGCKLRVPAGCVDAFNYSVFPTTMRISNQLPADVVMSPSI